MQEAVYYRSRHLQILMEKGPSGPRIGRKQVLILPAGDYPKANGTHPRKSGVWGKAAYEHWQSRVLIEGVPQSLFGSFLVIQKGTRPAGRNPLSRLLHK